MAEGPLPENNDAVVRAFIQVVAAALVSQAIAAFYSGESIERGAVGLGLGVAVSFIGFKWRAIKVRMGLRFSQIATNVATDFRWWLALIFIVFVYLGAPGFLGAVIQAIHQQTRDISRSTSVSATDTAATSDKGTAIACPPVPTPCKQ
jgi:hypothetical protein